MGSGTRNIFDPADHCPWMKRLRGEGATGLGSDVAQFHLGRDDYGVDFKVYGATASNYLLWDQSINSLVMAGRKATFTCALGAITSEEHSVDIVASGTLSSGEAFVGLNIVATAAGVGFWGSGMYVQFTQASKVISGYFCAAEFQLSSTAAQPSDHAVLVLNTANAHTGSRVTTPYILLREYGGDALSYANCFVRIYNDTGQSGTTDATKLITTVSDNYEQNCNYAIRCMLGTTPIWLLATSTAAA